MHFCDNSVLYFKFRERKYPLHFDNNIADALFRANCQKSHHRKDYKRSSKSSFMGMEVENQVSEQQALGPEKNRKRDVRDWQRGDDRGLRPQPHNAPGGETTVPRRGDIPVIHGDCDGERLILLYPFYKILELYRKDNL